MPTGEEFEDLDGDQVESDLIESEMALNPHVVEWERRRERARKERVKGLVERAYHVFSID